MDLDEFIDSIMKTETAPKFPLSMYYSEGVKYLNLRQHRKALEFLNEAVSNEPTDAKSLLKRSKCLIALRDFKAALDDANKTLDLCPESAEAIDLKGKAQYLMGDFEGGYLTYLKGKQLKPRNNVLRLGEQLCEDALNNSMKPHQSFKVKDSDVLNISKTQKDHKKFENKLKCRRSNRECFGKDKKFFEELAKDRNLASVRDICKEGIDFVNECEAFWCMENPLHLRPKRPKLVRREIKRLQDSERQVRICNAAKRRANSELEKGRIDDCITEVGKMLNVIEYLPKQNEEVKMRFICDAHHLLSLAYLKGGNTSLAFQQLWKELRIAIDFNLILPQTRACHELGEIYRAAGNMKKTFQCFDLVVSAFESEYIEKLTDESQSLEDIKDLQRAQQWSYDVMSRAKKSVRESIIMPVINTIAEYAEIMNAENLDEMNIDDSENEHL